MVAGLTMRFTLGEVAKIIESAGDWCSVITGGDFKIHIPGHISRCHGLGFNQGEHRLAVTGGFLRLLIKRCD